MIDIIIPAFNAHDTINQALLSIALQTIKDKVNVYIVDDCSDKDYAENLNLFKDKFNIKQLKLNKNMGPGFARQYGIDNSNGTYILFMDSDDLFVDCFSLENIYKKIITNDYDMCVGVMVDETDDECIAYENNQGCLHGKLYKRSFLNKNNIRFNDTRSSEDNGFNNLVLLCEPKLAFSSDYIYLYRNNYNSITQKDKQNYQFYSLEWYAYNMVWVCKNAEVNKRKPRMIAIFAYKSYIYMYYMYLNLCERPDSDKIFIWARDLEILVDKYESLLNDNQKTMLYFEYLYNGIPSISFIEFRNLVKMHNLINI